mmetsp:Transcript_11462/g.11485  ORF Transcript_11462/g.11485 Transcript_11462/m.11485 type:complete len:238 (+) Transcript_11462:185-898(+)|eukprot:CAMPEP_0182417206 /NCGR_PEP_ID=MMETSP1167-20130531/1636_1 /TAXON_ID=2988 /ORGANISM="Mallomonas Sp, Strain CCMP3275" /LENGTH=237 /DNA_ID=CAMNT_0024590601 /DNA_START=166 /DNA_END=879 /DNA_ORIENTATION=+
MNYFPSNKRKLQRELFLALDQQQDSHCNDFIRKCKEVDNEIIITSRDTRAGYEGKTLLHTASKLGYTAAVRYLLSVGHEIDPVDSSVSLITPLMEAIEANHIRTSCILVESGADLFNLDVRNENAVHYAARVGSRMVIGLMKSSKLPKEKIQELLSTSNVKHKFPEDMANSELTREVLHDYRTAGRHQAKNRKTLDSYEDILKKASTQKPKGHGFDYNFMFGSSDSDDGGPLSISNL